MKSLIGWAVKNSPALNTLLVAVLCLGAFGLVAMRRELYPSFELDFVTVTIPYPGASPAEVEEGICQKVEEAVRSIAGIKKQLSVAREGTGLVLLQLDSDVEDAQNVLNQVRSEIDRIPSLPELAEDPKVEQVTIRSPAIRIGILGPDVKGMDAELKLRRLAEMVRGDILHLPSVSSATILGGKDYQIDIEMSEQTLRKYGLTLQQVAELVRQENVELPGGQMRTPSRDILLRGKNRQLRGEGIAKIPILTEPHGTVLTVGDLGKVSDAFAEDDVLTSINGRPGLVIAVDRTRNEDLFSIVDDVKEHVGNFRPPPGYSLITWADQSVQVKNRMDLLRRNGLQGLALVVLVLAVFLDLRLALWVALGIPVAICGAGAVLYCTGQSMNMLTLFAFLMALGIVVDDAIVIGESIHEHRQRGKDRGRAAVDGTVEVLPSVLASVMTSIIAFLPLFFVSGILGKFIAVLPVAVVAMLLVSLLESTFMLPCHLAHSREHHHRPYGKLTQPARRLREQMPWALRLTAGHLLVALAWTWMHLVYPFQRLSDLAHWVSGRVETMLTVFIERVYRPPLRWAVRHPITMCSGVASLITLSLGLVVGGITPFIAFPKLDDNVILARIAYPDGTPMTVTDAATQRLLDALDRVRARYEAGGKTIIRTTHRAVGQTFDPTRPFSSTETVGANTGFVEADLVEASLRDVTCHQLLADWRKEAGNFVGSDSLVFKTPDFGPGGAPIELKLVADANQFDTLEDAAEACQRRLAHYRGVVDIRDDSHPGKWEYQLRVKDKAVGMGVHLADLAQTVRAAYHGVEVMRLQRGRHEVKLMVRYPRPLRQRLAGFDQIHVRTGDGVERPLTELADVQVARSYATIRRLDQQRSITVTADVLEGIGNAREIIRHLRADFVPQLLAKYPGVRVRWEGEQEQTAEAIESLVVGFGIALLAMFVLLTIQFRSYWQPLIVLVVVPVGLVGAIWGHVVMGIPMTMFTLFGLVALTGVVVNSSIILIDFTNRRIRDGLPIYEALEDAACRRFRPVLLTSVTTIVGLLPILTESSFQAQLLIPMVAALAYGMAAATVLVLMLAPACFAIYWNLTHWTGVPVATAGTAGRMARRPVSPLPAVDEPRSPAAPVTQATGDD